jgi:hypothetical protein
MVVLSFGVEGRRQCTLIAVEVTKMALRERAEEVAKNPWGQWGTIILALIGIITAYIELQQTKTEIERDNNTAEVVEGKADEELASSLSDTQTNLEEVWKYCRRAAEQSRRRDERQDQAIVDQRALTRRTAYGLDDARFTIQMLHPRKPAANFEREETFVEATEKLEEEYESTEDITAPDPPSANEDGLTIKKINPEKIKKLRRKEKSALQMPE